MAEPPQKIKCLEKNGMSEKLAAPIHIRQAIFEQFQEPVVFKGYILNDVSANCQWECMEWKEDKWERLFGKEKLTLRVNKRVENEMLSAPQWEGCCMKTSMTYSEMRSWAKSQDGTSLIKNRTLCGKEIDNRTHWVYFDYFYMKDLINMEQIDKAIDWNIFGFPERGVKDSTIWVGTCGANTPCHIDTYGCNLIAQIKGRKRWTLFPKLQSKSLYSTRVPYEESSIYSEVGFPSPNISIHPELMQSTPYFVTLEPGDVLFVPHHWWHFVEHLDFAISINTWLELPQDHCERTKEAIVMYQIGNLCQGINDPLVLRSIINPNMLDLLELGSEQLLAALSDRILTKQDERAMSDECLVSYPKDKNINNKNVSIESDFISDLTVKYGDIDVEELIKKWCIDYNIKKIEKISYAEYSKINKRPFSLNKCKKDIRLPVKLENSLTEIDQTEYVKSDESELNAEIINFKILVNSLCDDRVLDIMKSVLIEKLQQK